MLEIVKNKTFKEAYEICQSEYNNDIELQKLREYIKQHHYGYCDDAHYTMWREIVKLLPDDFSFVEFGVFKGQIPCLITLLSERYKKNGRIYGVTPMVNHGDKYSIYDDVDYSVYIDGLFKNFSLPFDINKQILKGLSTDETIKNNLRNLKYFDLMFIDGGHDYDTVISDLNLAKEITKSGSLIVLDDASCYRNFEGLPIFTGHIDVCNAIRDNLEVDSEFVEIACVGHNRVFRRL